MGDVTVHVSADEPEREPDVPVKVTVEGTTVSFNGVPTLHLVAPMGIDVVLADPVTQEVAAMYRAGYVHRHRA